MDTLVLETMHPAHEYLPGGRQCSMRRYIASFFSPSSYALWALAILGIAFAVMLWEVGKYVPANSRFTVGPAPTRHKDGTQGGAVGEFTLAVGDGGQPRHGEDPAKMANTDTDGAARKAALQFTGTRQDLNKTDAGGRDGDAPPPDAPWQEL